MFNFLKNSLQKIYSGFSTALSGILGKSHLDEQTCKELEILLLSADTGISTTKMILNHLKRAAQADTPLRETLRPLLLSFLEKPKQGNSEAHIHLLVGINGSGKTTFAGKLAQEYINKGKKPLLVAADTFRAAAPEQLTQWASQTGSKIILGSPGQDPASVVFKGCETFKQQNYDALIIDTAGRLQTKTHLMHELNKIKRVITKQLSHYTLHTLLTIDSMLGQNSLEQAKLFKEATDVDGIVLTKMDGTGKGGIVFAITNELEIPIRYITYGEKIHQIKKFNAQEYVNDLLQQ